MLGLDYWDLAPVSIPPRSRLYSIPPFGVGTPLVESLVGYLIRLAGSHAVRVSDLAARELRASIPNFQEPAIVANAINGVGKIAQQWVAALEQFTLRTDLRLLTLLPFSPVLNARYLMRRKRAWCSHCLGNNSPQETGVYEQLIWCLQCVEVCPLHRVPLETACPACRRHQEPISAVSRPGLCSRCRYWLGSVHRSTDEVPATDYQIWVGEEFGKLLATAPGASLLTKQNVGEVVSCFVDTISDGNRNNASAIAGCNPSSLRSWYRGIATPRIGIILRMCYEMKISLTAIVTGIASQSKSEVGASLPITRSQRQPFSPQRAVDKIRAALQHATTEFPAPSIREVAQRLGYSTPNRLYAADSELSKTIVRNFNKSGKRLWKKRGVSLIIRRRLEEALSFEMPPPLHTLGVSLGYQTGQPLRTRFPDLCQAILRKRAKVRKSRRNEIVHRSATLSKESSKRIETK